MPFSSYLKAYYRYLPTGEFKVQTVVPHGVTRARLEFLQWSGADDLALSLGLLRCSLEHEMFGALLEFVEQHFVLAAASVLRWSVCLGVPCLRSLALSSGQEPVTYVVQDEK